HRPRSSPSLHDPLPICPAIIRQVVDFPQPDGPTNTINSLSSFSKLKSWMTSLPFLSYLFLIFFNFILDMNLFHLPERSNYNVSLGRKNTRLHSRHVSIS